MNDTFLTELGKSGPWAVVAGFLLWTIIKAWTKDREQVTSLLGTIKPSLDLLVSEIQGLSATFREYIQEERVERYQNPHTSTRK